MSDETSVATSAPETVQNAEVPAQNTESTPETTEVEAKPEVTPAQAEAIRKFKIKIDGKEQEVEETEMIRNYQKFAAAEKRFAEASSMKKQADSLIAMLREDPRAALSHPAIGHDVRKLAEQIIAEQLEEEMSSPEQRELKKAQKELEKYKKLEADQKRTAEEQQLQQLTEHYTNQIQEGIVKALDKSGLPKTNHTVKRMAYYLHQAMEKGYEVEPIDVVDLVKKDYLSEIKDLLGASDGQVLMDLLGDDVAKKLRSFDLARVKQSSKPVNVASNKSFSSPSTSNKQKISWEDLHKKAVDMAD